jgi:hypothetical protein
MNTPHINTRDEIPHYLQQAGLNRYGIELGVAKGNYTVKLLSVPWLRLYAVDRWSDHHDDNEARTASERILQTSQSAVVLRRTFDEALPLFDDGFFNFIYIDGYAHTGQEGGKTLEDWWPKLRSGGLFAGHDYAPKYQPTIDAVDRFMLDHGLTDLTTTTADQLPSWLLLKP